MKPAALPTSQHARRRNPLGCVSSLVRAVAALLVVCSGARGYDLHFDYTSFDNPNTPGVDPHFGQSQFNVLNYPSINGNYMMTSTDTHRPEMLANNNNLAEFYNWLEQRYEAHTTKDGNVSADEINDYVTSNSPSIGPPPVWLILNEMSTSLWPNNATYRAWLIATATRLHDFYGYNVVTYTTFANPSGNAADWQALAAKSYISIENYLSGQEILAHGSDYSSRLTWAQAQYAWSKTAFGQLGVSASRLFLSEHVGNTAATYTDGSGTHTTGWGRAGVSSTDWDAVLQVRSDAIYNANYPGVLAYGWSANGMLVTEAEQIQHEYYYRTRMVMPTQQPQWLPDNVYSVNGTSIPLSWNQPLNWLGHGVVAGVPNSIPNSAGALANFFRTNTAARSVTLDTSVTVGTLTFNSPNAYTITPGSGGTLTLNNSGAPASISVSSGSHTISAPTSFASDTSFSIASGAALTVSGASSGAGNWTKTGAGTLTISGPQSHSAGTILNANTGTTNLNSDAGSAGSQLLTVNVGGGSLNLNSAQHLLALNVTAGGAVVASGSTLTATNVSNSAALTLAPAAASVQNLVLNSTSTLTMNLAGVNPGTQYPQFSISGSATLGGVLTIQDINGFSPQAGASFQLFTGALVGHFSSLNLPTLASGLSWNTTQLTSAGTLSVVHGCSFSVPGDFDHDCDVDATDFIHFNACELGPGIAPADPTCSDADLDGDGDVDQQDFGIFQRCFSGAFIPANPSCSH